MNDKRLSEGGDEVVLADAARAKTKMPKRSKQLPVILIFLVIALAFATYNFF